jgi:hypothetical protein
LIGDLATANQSQNRLLPSVLIAQIDFPVLWSMNGPSGASS